MKKQSRVKRKEMRKEEQLNSRTEWGVKDLTPYNAVKAMNGKTITYK